MFRGRARPGANHAAREAAVEDEQGVPGRDLVGVLLGHVQPDRLGPEPGGVPVRVGRVGEDDVAEPSPAGAQLRVSVPRVVDEELGLAVLAVGLYEIGHHAAEGRQGEVLVNVRLEAEVSENGPELLHVPGWPLEARPLLVAAVPDEQGIGAGVELNDLVLRGDDPDAPQRRGLRTGGDGSATRQERRGEPEERRPPAPPTRQVRT